MKRVALFWTFSMQRIAFLGPGEPLQVIYINMLCYTCVIHWSCVASRVFVHYRLTLPFRYLCVLRFHCVASVCSINMRNFTTTIASSYHGVAQSVRVGIVMWRHAYKRFRALLPRISSVSSLQLADG